MKYIKSFGQINEKLYTEQELINRTRKAANQSVTLESILKSFFALFMDINAIKEIWTTRKREKESMNIATDIYKHFIDVNDILDLPLKQKMRYAINLGISSPDEEKVSLEIAKQLYVQNYKRDLIVDMDKTIKYLEDGSKFNAYKEVSQLFSWKIKEIKDKL